MAASTPARGEPGDENPVATTNRHPEGSLLVRVPVRKLTRPPAVGVPCCSRGLARRGGSPPLRPRRLPRRARRRAEPLLAAADAEVDGLLDDVPPAEGTGGPGPNLCSRPELGCRAATVSCATHRPSGSPRSLSPRLRSTTPSTTSRSPLTVPPFHHVPGGPHIDGHRPGPYAPASFTLLAASCLTDQRASSGPGNLWVWPGSYLDHQRLFLERGTDGSRRPVVTPRSSTRPCS